MQIEELLKLTSWFKSNVEKNNVPQNYTNLFNKMNVNIRRPNGQQNQPFIDEKNNLFESLSKIDFNELTIEQIKFLKELKVDKLINKKTVDLINDNLTSNNLDISSATNIIKDYRDKVIAAQNKFDEINNLLTPYFNENLETEIRENEVLMRIYFQEGVAISNLNDLKKISSNWFDISRGIAIAMNQTPEDFRVISAKKGSIIIDLAIMVGVATAMSKILLEALKVADRVLDIRKKVEEIKGLKLSNKKIELELNKEADLERDNGVKKIVEETISQLGLIKETEGDKITAIEKSIKKLLEFTENGGQVDFTQNDKTVQEDLREINLQLKNNIEEIRKLESRLKYLEK
ncbi:hypothetical protein [Flavobacterium mekongense]|uniref:hypothetical protein n=1 Tax=Flavobacterium mekongense TaxID=3379707 RepID=UPI00399BF647